MKQRSPNSPPGESQSVDQVLTALIAVDPVAWCPDDRCAVAQMLTVVENLGMLGGVA